MNTAPLPITSTALSFGEWLKRRRKTLDLTRERLAWQVGCSFETIKKIEASDLKPSIQLAELIAGALSVPASEQAAFVQFARDSMATAPATAYTGNFVAPLPADRPSELSPAPYLPEPLTSLIGRADAIRTATDLLRRADVRFLTLSGPPGVGKSRLSLAIAAQLAPEFADSAYFVALAPISDPDLVPFAIAQSLGIQEVIGQPLLMTLKEALRQRQLLLVVDNFEHLLDAASCISELLAAAARLKIIISSREALQVYGEYELSVSPLAIPDLHHLPPLPELAQVAAIALFVERAQASKLNFTFTSEHAEEIAQICILLDGLPLAIEMAAAQIRRASPVQILKQLHERLLALRMPARDSNPRHQTLFGAIEWSYQLLAPPEQHLFRVLSVFVDGCTLEAIAAMLEPGLTNDRSLQHALSMQLEALVDKHLVCQITQAGELRYSMLAPIHAYAQEQLHAHGELEDVRQRHAMFFADWAEGVESRLQGAEQIGWLERLECEHNNLRAAVEWALQHDSVLGLRLASALWDFWVIHGHHHEWLRRMQELLARALPQLSSAYPLAYVQGLTTAGFLLWLHGQVAEARPLLETARTLSEASAFTPALARASFYLGLVSTSDGHVTEAKLLLEQSLADWRALGDRFGCGWALIVLGDITIEQGDLAGAHALYEDACVLLRTLGNRNLLAYALRRLATIALRQSNNAHAIVCCQESLVLNVAVGDKRGIAGSLIGLAAISAMRRQWVGVARLLGAVAALVERVATTLLPTDQADFDRALDATRSHLSAPLFAAMWEAGRALTLTQAMATALADDPDTPSLQVDNSAPCYPTA
jgi:predicted ATPase/transcriptional regulator with XRE-family HTH domain